jgi:hypothetical protein
MAGVGRRIISNIHNTPITSYYKLQAGIDAAQPASKKKVTEKEAEAEKWYKKYGEIYKKRGEEKPPLPKVGRCHTCLV